MTTLIAVGNSEGCYGRCDAKCYNASCPECTCICNGANHGKGLEKAMEQTREMYEQWMERYESEHEGGKGLEWQILEGSTAWQQLELPLRFEWGRSGGAE